MLTLESILRTTRYLNARSPALPPGAGAAAAPAADGWRARAEGAEALLAMASSFDLGGPEARYGRSIRVEARGHGLWAVTRSGAVLATDGEWEYEPLPSSRDDEFLARTRFALDEAMERGTAAVAREAAEYEARRAAWEASR